MRDSSDDNADGAPIGQFLTYRMARVQAKLNAQATRLLKEEAGLTLTQWRLLALIGATGRATAAQLSRLAAMDKGLISRNLKCLTEAGLVVITPDSIDHRAQHLELSAEGKEIFESTLPRMHERQAALRSRLENDELRHFLSALEKLESAADDGDLN